MQRLVHGLGGQIVATNHLDQLCGFPRPNSQPLLNTRFTLESPNSEPARRLLSCDTTS